VVALDGIWLEPGSVVHGDVAVVFPGPGQGPARDEEIHISPGARVAGSVQAEDVWMGPTAVVTGTIRAKGLVELGAQIGQRGPPPILPLALSLPSFPWFVPGSEAVRVPPGETAALRAGRYSHVVVGSGADAETTVLTLEGGTYDLLALEIGPLGRAECTSPCQIRVLGPVRLGVRAYLGRAQDSRLGVQDIELLVAGADAGLDRRSETGASIVEIGESARLEAHLYAPNGTVSLRDSAHIRGAVVGRGVFLGHAARVEREVDQPPVESSREDAAVPDAEPLGVRTGESSVRSFRPDPSLSIRLEDLFDRYPGALGLGAADAMVAAGDRRTIDGRTHRRFTQFHRGVPVFGADFTVQVEGGRVLSGIGRIVPALDVATVPGLSEQEALAHALTAVPATRYRWQAARPLGRPGTAALPRGTLGIGSRGFTMEPGSYRLVYRFRIDSLEPFASETIDIDATTGDVMGRFSNIVRYSVPSGGDTLHYGWKSFVADAFEDAGQTRYRLVARDFVSGPTSPLGVPVGITTVRGLGLNPGPGALPSTGFLLGDYVVEHFVDDDNDFRSWPASSFSAASSQLGPLISGVSVHWALQQAVEYWKKANWLGIDGAGAKQILAVIDCPKAAGESQAYYRASDDTFCFGYSGSNSLVHLNVVGHEFAHAVFAHATRPLWALEVEPTWNPTVGEMAVLNEGFADVFGYLLDQKPDNWCGEYSEGPQLSYKDDQGNGSCDGGTALCPGEQCDPTTLVCSLKLPAKCESRDLSNPKSTQNPDTFEGQYFEPFCGWDPEKGKPTGDCHQDSTILSHWFYILVKGKQGTNDRGHAYAVSAIGRDKAEQIAIRTLVAKLWSSGSFLGARLASIQAAEDLSFPGSPEVVAVTNAWHAVGVGGPHDERYYSPSAVSGVDPWPTLLKWESLPGETDWQVEVSTNPSFDQEVKLLGPQISMMTAGKLTIGASTVLKPTTAYYWRVRARKSPTLTKDPSPEVATGAKKKAPSIPTSPTGGSGYKVTPSVPTALLGGWGEWGATQEFMTAAKIPDLTAPAPVKQIKVSIPSKSGSEPAAGGPGIAAPGLSYPWNTEFRWKAVPGAAQYRLTVSEDPDESCPPAGGKKLNLPSAYAKNHWVDAPKLSGATVSYEVPLRSGRTYYWWLMVFGPGGIPGDCAYGGTPVRFQTSIPKALLKGPANGSTVSPFETTLTWEPVKGASGYQLEVIKLVPKGTPLSKTIEDVALTSKTVQPAAEGKFFWRVRAKGPLADDVGAFSGSWSFVADLALTKPELVFPAKEFWSQYATPMDFSWSPVPGATGYLLTVYRRQADQTVGAMVAQVGTGFSEIPSGAGPKVNVHVDGVTTHPSGYCWEVSATGPGGLMGVASDVWCYGVGAGSVTILSPAEGATGVEFDQTVVTWACPHSPGGYWVAFSKKTAAGLCTPETTEPATSGATSLSRTLAPDTAYCVRVTSRKPDGTDGFWDQVEFQTKPKPAPPPDTCKEPGAIVFVEPPGVAGPLWILYASWDRRLQWIEYDKTITEYKVTVYGGYLTIPATQPWVVWPGAPVAASSVPGQPSGSATLRVYQLPPLAGSKATGQVFAVKVEARTGSMCAWTQVGGTIPLYFDW
jgi:Zn-dependent metalloprotease